MMATAKFTEIAAMMRQRVQNGYYSLNQKLPSEYALATEFGVSRLTVRKAIDVLIAQHLLIKNPGQGTYIIPQTSKIESGRLGLQSFTEVAKAFGKTPRTEVLRFTPIDDLPADVARELQVDPAQTPMVELIRRRFWDDDPMTVEHLYLPAAYVEGCTSADLAGSLFTQLEKHVKIAYSQQLVEATLATSTLGEQLNLPIGAPILQVSSVTYTASAKPIYYDQSVYRADKYSIKSTLTR